MIFNKQKLNQLEQGNQLKEKKNQKKNILRINKQWQNKSIFNKTKTNIVV